jgi:hypothetical protein
MVTVLEDYTNEEQRSVVVFWWSKDSMQRIFIKKCFLSTVGSLCRVKWFTTGWQTFRWCRRGWNVGAEVAETTVKRLLCYGFRRTGKAMGHEYQCWWRICRVINVLFGSNIFFYVLYPFMTYLLILSRNKIQHMNPVGIYVYIYIYNYLEHTKQRQDKFASNPV